MEVIDMHKDLVQKTLTGWLTRTVRSSTNEALTAGRQIVTCLLDGYSGSLAVYLWNGERVFGQAAAALTLTFHDPSVLRHLILHQDFVRFIESYVIGDVAIDGDMELLLEVMEYVQNLQLSSADKRSLWCWAASLRRTRSADLRSVYARQARQHSNSRETISYHYDVSNDFYRLWLDPEMVYSCAYFRDEAQSLAEAQQDKLDYICRKLYLQPGQTLLDIGCGWGALAIWAARHYGVQVHGITLSEQQHEYGHERVQREGLADRVRLELRDYRDLPDSVQYDRVVSVGMFEHVGIRRFPEYFTVVKQALKPGGLFLNHGITNDTGWLDNPVTRFIQRYVFPDAELARISDVVDAMEKAGFEIVDVEGLRRHYAMTLRRWVQALETNRHRAVALVGEDTYRVWRLYMSGCAYYFANGGTNIYQVIAGHMYQPLATPLRRTSLYTGTNTAY
jgi:cyclopropane-fatty-acyl-phospholipid synthase